ncbi:MAG: hypothetical protein WCI89_00740 [bacterium]
MITLQRVLGATLGVVVLFAGSAAPAHAFVLANPATPTTPVSPAPASSVCPYVWKSTLRLGSSGEGVLHLQQFLNSSPDTKVAEVGAGSPGHEGSVFGALTKKAVARFQEKYAEDILTPAGLLKGTGAVGVATRTKLNQLCSAPLVAPLSPATVGGPTLANTSASAPISTSTNAPKLIITPAPQPAHELAPANALYVPVTAVTLTAQGADVTVNHVTVKRIGASADNALSYVSLLDEDGSELSYAFIHSDHTATFPDSFIIPASTSKTLTVAANMASDLTDYDGQQVGFEIDSIDASAPVVGTLPVTGTFQTANASLIIGSALAELSMFDPNSATTHYINDMGVRFSGIKITAGNQENLTLHSVSWRSSGSASISDFSNLVVVVGDKTFSTTEDDKYITADFGPTGIRIAKGQSVDAYIKGDVGVGAANRTVQFDIDYPTDISITGDTYGYGIYLLPGGNTAVSGNSVFLTADGTTDTASGFPFFVGSSASIQGGTMTSIGRN